jgi:hypothetical protein
MKCCKILVFQRRIWPTRHKLARNIVVIKMDALIVKHVFFSDIDHLVQLRYLANH